MESVDIYSSPDRPSPWQLYKILTLLTGCYCIFSIATLIISPIWPLSVYLPVIMLVIPAISITHALTQRHLCATVQLIHQYYASAIGLFYGFLTFSCAVFLISSAWGVANGILRFLFIFQCFIGCSWMCMWSAVILYRILKKSAIQHQGGGDYSVFLLLRCACMPPESKKMITISPLFFLGFFFLIESFLSRYVSFSSF